MATSLHVRPKLTAREKRETPGNIYIILLQSVYKNEIFYYSNVWRWSQCTPMFLKPTKGQIPDVNWKIHAYTAFCET